MCPVSREEMNGRHPFCSDLEDRCGSCQEMFEREDAELFEVAECSFEDDDVISLNPDERGV